MLQLMLGQVGMKNSSNGCWVQHLITSIVTTATERQQLSKNRLKKHKKIYLDFFKYKEGDYVPCECCSKPATDIHHISPRGMGGDPQGKKDVIENLVGLCRACHDQTRDAKFNDQVKKNHLLRVKLWRKKYK